MEAMQKNFLNKLTNPQKSILMSENFFGDPHIYVIPAWAVIKEEINFDALEEAINITVKNHDAHRTRFIKMGEETYQYFENYTPFKVTKITVNDISELEDYLKGITFDIYSASPIKFVMFENLSGFDGFCCVLHHLIGDAWSLSLILEETLKSYNSIIHPEHKLKARQSSYKDFIESEKDYLSSSKFEKDKAYWEEKFNTSIETLTFKSANNIFETESMRKSIMLPAEITKYCLENKISLFSFFFAIVSIYFARISNIYDITIGTPFLNRTNANEKNSMGMFISSLPFRQQIDEKISVSKYIKDITINQLGALRHQKYPYDELQRYYTKKYGRTNNLYDIIFSYQNAKAENNLDFEFESSWVFTNHQAETLAISISDIDSTNNYRIDYDYINKILSEHDILKLHERLMYLANQIIKNPEIEIKDLEVVTPLEQDILINKFNNTKVDYDKNATIATLISDVAKKSPNSIALCFEDTSLTYKELDEKTNYLADKLTKEGVERNTFVGVLFNRSIEMIVSIIAVLKAGAAYMPINPDYPDDRITYMIEDSNSKLLLASSDMKFSSPLVKKIIVNYDELGKKGSFENISKPDDLAYIIYTSGSTGKPKGVMIRHYSIVNTLLWRKEEYKFDKNIAVLQIPSFAFDSSVEDIFTPLISGSKLVLVNQSNSNFDVPLIKSLIPKHKLNHMLVVPSFYNVLLNEIPEELKGFKSITVAGEGFSIELVKRHFETLPNVELFNEYGPTENSVCTTYYKFSKDDNEVLIGRPINNCSCYILNQNLKLQPFNIKGELYVSGPGLAKGYIGRQDLTSSRFIKNPFKPDELMYKTGDVVSINEDGIMTFHERVDYQVKYNGFRINLGEIESQISILTKNPNVVALLKKNEASQVLVAYIESNKKIDTKNLKQELKKFLPYYMIPKEIDVIKKFPLTPNAKIDRKALSMLNLKPKDTIIVAPRNKLDAKILEAWKKVLKQENISIEDNIFEIGGDSLSIISIQSYLFKNGITVKSQALFENPTIKSVSDYIKANEEHTKNNKEENFLPKSYSNSDYIKASEQHTEKNKEKIFLPKSYSKSDVSAKGSKPKNILLTGVTGFLGSHILAELMNKYNDITVYCLVRSKPNKPYDVRLKEILHYYFKNKYDLLINNRIIPIEGDLVRANLGIDITKYKELITKIDTIINSASLVKHFGDYNLFYNTNVVSVQSLIKFAKEANAKINHISTTSVSGNYLVQNNITYDYTENDFFIGQNYQDNVYVRTKFEAENELFKAENEDNLKVNIFRIGNLMQRMSDGVFQINKFDNAYFKRIYGFTKIKKLPKNLVTQKMEFTPVDSCVEAIVKLLPYENKVFHLLNPNVINITQLLSNLEKYNIHVEFIDSKNFSKLIHSDEGAQYLQNFVTDLNNSKELNYDTNITINDELTEYYLENNNFKWPHITDEYIDNFIKNILKSDAENDI